jgi:hypothetical protein
MNTVTERVTLTVTRCINCGVQFAAPDYFVTARQNDGKSFYCPNGHSLCWHETEADKLRKRLERSEARERHALDQLQATERSRAALRGVVTKTKKRVGNGVCPCCNRTFQNLARHMAGKHPEYADSASP